MKKYLQQAVPNESSVEARIEQTASHRLLVEDYVHISSDLPSQEGPSIMR